MSEDLTPPPSEPQADDAFADVIEMNKDMRAKRQQELDAQATKDAAEAAARAKRLERLRTARDVGIGIGAVAAVGAVFGNAIGNHAEDNATQNQEWYDEAQQAEDQFYKDNNILPPAMQEEADRLRLEPSPSPDTIPSPTDNSIEVPINEEKTRN